MQVEYRTIPPETTKSAPFDRWVIIDPGGRYCSSPLLDGADDSEDIAAKTAPRGCKIQRVTVTIELHPET
jgi:hypothetical protein